MKKLTVMAACAALLLGGGCFLKADSAQNNLLLKNVVAFCSGEDGISDGESGGSFPGYPILASITVTGLQPYSVYYPANGVPYGPKPVDENGKCTYDRYRCYYDRYSYVICEESNGTVAIRQRTEW